MNRLRGQCGERGAVAVEFALILPILLVLVLGIFEFGRLYNLQISVTNAAREGARVMAITKDPAAARAAAIEAAPSVNNPEIQAGDITFSPAACANGAQMKVTITYSVSFMTGYFDGLIPPLAPLQGKGAMRCGG